ncbi:MAG TPA: hypothetical protein VF491_12620, partial [Vicinamibacterales bacterium]
TKYVQGPQQRDTHAKGLATVRGTFSVEPNLPPELAVGLFSKVKTYPCVCRFSNTDPNPKADIENDMRAISIKVIGVDGKMLWTDDPESNTLDLLMMTAQTFITPDIKTFIKLQSNLLHVYLHPRLGNLRLIWFFLTHPGTMRRVIKSEIKFPNLVEVPYFSEVAYRFGEKAVQYKLAPHKQPTSRLPGAGAPNNYLNLRLREDLAAGDVVFDFMVQFQVDPVKTPIEDVSVPWSETLSPPRKVATLTLSKQDVAEPALGTTGEFMTFNPWRTLPEHQPLGWCNRVRMSIYQTIAEFRHSKNAVRDREPRE